MGQSQSSIDELIRNNRRKINHSIRRIDVDRLKMLEEKSRIERSLKAAAKSGDRTIIEPLAENYLRIKQGLIQCERMKGTMNGSMILLSNVRTTQELNMCMGSLTKSLITMNKQLPLGSVRDMVHSFQRESYKSEMVADLTSDMVNSGFNYTEDEKHGLVDQVLDEVGISLPSVPDSIQVGLEERFEKLGEK